MFATLPDSAEEEAADEEAGDERRIGSSCSADGLLERMIPVFAGSDFLHGGAAVNSAKRHVFCAFAQESAQFDALILHEGDAVGRIGRQVRQPSEEAGRRQVIDREPLAEEGGAEGRLPCAASCSISASSWLVSSVMRRPRSRARVP